MNELRENLSRLDRNSKLVILLLNDFFIAFFVWVVIGPPLVNFLALGFQKSLFDIIASNLYQFLPSIILSMVFMYFFGLYKSLIRFFDSMYYLLIYLIGSLIFGFGSSLIYILQFSAIERSILIITFLQGLVISATFYSMMNISRDIAKYFLYPYKKLKTAKPVVIYGSGSTGKELMETILRDPNKDLLAFYDESAEFSNRAISNIPIYSNIKHLKRLRSLHPTLEVLLAIPSLDIDSRRRVISELEKLRISVRTVPSYSELILDEGKLSDIQNLSLEDLLPSKINTKYELNDASNREFLISGAGGSIGSEIVRQLILNDPKKIVLLDISEFNLFRIYEESKILIMKLNLKTEIVPILGDINDNYQLEHIFKNNNLDTVYHAAAYKHVPLIERLENTFVSVNNNFKGTVNISRISKKYKVKRFVLISTDKAVRPTNIMGATKRMAELFIQALNENSPETKFSMVRFGNVINSSGSVVPTFLEQIAKGGPLTLTHRHVTRYFMSIPDASSLVIEAGEISQGGEVFILDMGEQIKIYDLAKRLIHLSGRNVADEENPNGISITEIGLRPGEKMYEELLISGGEEKTENERIFKSREDFVSLETMNAIILKVDKCIADRDIKELRAILSEYVSGFTNITIGE